MTGTGSGDDGCGREEAVRPVSEDDADVDEASGGQARQRQAGMPSDALVFTGRDTAAEFFATIPPSR
jgi:hypothetical protein